MRVTLYVYLVLLIMVVVSACAGRPGDSGAVGTPGVSPAAPTITQRVADPSECPTGGIVVVIQHTGGIESNVVCNGQVGLTGPQGSTGATGAAGNDGSNGTNANQVTIVQFCPGATVYPSQFNEIGFCLDGNLYGTYSANGGFSTLLPPGYYASNGINSSCNFTILPNCGVSH